MCTKSSTNPLASPLPGHDENDDNDGDEDGGDGGDGDVDRPDDDDQVSQTTCYWTWKDLPDSAACESPGSATSSAGRH